MYSSLCLEGSKLEFGSGLKSQLGFVQHFGRAVSPWARKFYPVKNWSEEEFEQRQVLPCCWSQTLPWEANTALRLLLLQLKFPSLDPFHTYVIKLCMGGSSSLLEKMHGGVCGGGVCITCSGLDFSTSQLKNKCKMVPPEVPTPQSRQQWMRRGWSCGMGLPLLSCFRKPSRNLLRPAAAWGKSNSVDGKGQSLTLPPDLCE